MILFYNLYLCFLRLLAKAFGVISCEDLLCSMRGVSAIDDEHLPDGKGGGIRAEE